MRAGDSALQMRPKTFDGISAINTTFPLVNIMVDATVPVSQCFETGVRAMSVGGNCSALSYIGLNNRYHCCNALVLNDMGLDSTIALHDAHNGSLVFQKEAFAVTFEFAKPSTDIGFVNFDMAGKRTRILLEVPRRHQVTQLLADAPCTFVGHAKLPLQFFSRHAIASSGHQIDGVEPSCQDGAGMFKDRPGAGIDMATGRACECATASDPREFADDATMWARMDVFVPPFEDGD